MKRPRVITVLGTRPEIIKLSKCVRLLDQSPIDHYLIHTNQHYDYEMDRLFIRELGLRDPDIRLPIRSSSPAVMLGEMTTGLGEYMEKVNAVFQEELKGGAVPQQPKPKQ